MGNTQQAGIAMNKSEGEMMTDRERVLKVHPNAYALKGRCTDMWSIWTSRDARKRIGLFCESEELAWASAASQLPAVAEDGPAEGIATKPTLSEKTCMYCGCKEYAWWSHFCSYLDGHKAAEPASPVAAQENTTDEVRALLEKIRDDDSGRDHFRNCRTNVYYLGLKASQDDRCSICEAIDSLLDKIPASQPTPVVVSAEDTPLCPKCNHPHYNMEDSEFCRSMSETSDAPDYPRWECFHCGFKTSEEREAAAHFGDRDDAEEFKPLCKWWKRMDDGERAKTLQDTIQQLNDALSQIPSPLPVQEEKQGEISK